MKIPIQLIPQSVIPRDPNLTFRLQRLAPVVAVETVEVVIPRVALGMIFHDAYDGSGGLDGHVADTGQAWATESPAVVLDGAATCIQGFEANAQALLTPVTVENFDWITVIRNSDGDGALNDLNDGQYQVQSDLGADAGDAEYLGFYAAPLTAEFGGPRLAFYWTGAAETHIDLAAAGLNFDLDVPHTVWFKARGATLTVLWDGVEVFSGTWTPMSNIGNVTLALESEVGGGKVNDVLDSVLIGL